MVLSDIIGDPLDMIASGPAYPDASTCAQALEIAQRYDLRLSDAARSLLGQETPKALANVTTFITGSVRQLCRTAAETCRALGYEPVFLTASLTCEAREAGAFLAAIARDHQDTDRSLAFLAGGETVVHLTGKGLGGRNQEIALGAAEGIAGLPRHLRVLLRLRRLRRTYGRRGRHRGRRHRLSGWLPPGWMSTRCSRTTTPTTPSRPWTA